MYPRHIDREKEKRSKKKHICHITLSRHTIKNENIFDTSFLSQNYFLNELLHICILSNETFLLYVVIIIQLKEHINRNFSPI